MAKAKKPAAKKVGSTAAAAKAKGPGVIETIIATISGERGASADEVLEILKGKFPDRDPDGMRRTIGIQAPKNCTSKGDDEKRGRVFYRRGRGPMMSKCWKTGDSEGDVLAKLKAAQAELLLIIEADDVNAFDIVDLRSVIARLEEAILTCKLKR